MRGRAGRKGKDEVGETYLICQKADLEAVSDLLEAETPAIESCLSPGKRGVKRLNTRLTPAKILTHIPKGAFGSNRNQTGFWSRRDRGIHQMYSPLQNIG